MVFSTYIIHVSFHLANLRVMNAAFLGSYKDLMRNFHVHVYLWAQLTVVFFLTLIVLCDCIMQPSSLHLVKYFINPVIRGCPTCWRVTRSANASSTLACSICMSLHHVVCMSVKLTHWTANLFAPPYPPSVSCPCHHRRPLLSIFSEWKLLRCHCCGYFSLSPSLHQPFTLLPIYLYSA